MRAAISCAVWLASVLALAAPAPERCLEGISRTGLCLTPWFLFAGLPRAARAANEPRTPWASTIALAIPPLALALRIDLAAGFDARAVGTLAALGIAFSACLACAAASSTRDEPRARRYAIGWMTLVLGAPLLVEALERGGLPAYGAAPGWLELLARASPLDWILRATTSVGAARPGEPALETTRLASALMPAGACAVLASLGGVAARRESRA